MARRRPTLRRPLHRNFKTNEEACAEKATLEIKAAQIELGRPNEIATSLTIEQVRDAETASRRLEGAGHSLMFCADFTLTNYRKPARQRLLAEAVADYLAAKRARARSTRDHGGPGDLHRSRAAPPLEGSARPSRSTASGPI